MHCITGFVVVAALLAGCDSGPAPKYAQDSNAKRKQIGLPVIAAGWMNYNKGNNAKEAAWRTPDSHLQTPNHSGKKVLYESGRWEMEQDYYYSGKTFPSHDPDGGTESEQVVVSYVFVERPGYPKGWTCHYNSPTNWVDTISLDEAEKILSKWGIKRLNY